MSQRPWDRMGGTLEGRHRGGPRTERQTPETNKGDHPRDRRGDRGTPEIGRGARDPDREARERREEDTLQSEGGKWDMEVPGDLISRKTVDAETSLEMGGPTILICGTEEEAPGAGDLPTETRQVLTKPGRAGHLEARHHRDQRAHCHRHPPQTRQLWPKKGQPGCPLSTRQGQGRAARWSPPAKGPQRGTEQSSGGPRTPSATSLPRVQASTCVTCCKLGLSLEQGEHDWAPLFLMGAPGLAAPRPDVARCSGPASARRRNGAPAGPKLGHPRAATCSVLSCGHRCRPSGTCVTQYTPTAVPGS